MQMDPKQPSHDDVHRRQMDSTDAYLASQNIQGFVPKEEEKLQVYEDIEDEDFQKYVYQPRNTHEAVAHRIENKLRYIEHVDNNIDFEQKKRALCAVNHWFSATEWEQILNHDK